MPGRRTLSIIPVVSRRFPCGCSSVRDAQHYGSGVSEWCWVSSSSEVATVERDEGSGMGAAPGRGGGRREGDCPWVLLRWAQGLYWAALASVWLKARLE